MYKAKQILDYRIAWKDYDCLKLKYEDLLEKNQETIQKIAKYLKTELNKDQVLKIQKETNIDKILIPNTTPINPPIIHNKIASTIN